jgi:peptidoglycan-associated lipoprotein
MNRTVHFHAAIVLAAALGLNACGRKEPELTPAPPPPAPPPATKPADPPPPPPPPPPAPKPPERALTEDEIFDKMTLDELNDKMRPEPVFFAYDSTVISEEARATLQKTAEFLKRRASTQIMIEGHADNRGTNEYNLALGERRAEAARDYLVGLGIAADRIQTVTKGEEQPFCREDTESCWQENRRGHFLFTKK